MPLTLYELKGKGALRFSPYCWRTRMALAHKGLTADLVPVGFSDKPLIAFSGQGKVPILVDDGQTVHDSWTIACHLEDRYPDRPSLFSGPGGRALARFVNLWTDKQVHGAISPLIVGDIPGILDEPDRTVFVSSRAERLATWIRTEPERDVARRKLADVLTPVRDILAERPFLSGTAPAYADYILLGPFQWARCVSATPLLDRNDPVHAWRSRMMEAHGGLCAKAPGQPLD